MPLIGAVQATGLTGGLDYFRKFLEGWGSGILAKGEPAAAPSGELYGISCYIITNDSYISDVYYIYMEENLLHFLTAAEN